MTARDYLVCNQYRGGLERLRLAIDDHRSALSRVARRTPQGRPRLVLVRSLVVSPGDPDPDINRRTG
ncbi:MAG TPA: hypothetical protein VFQ71_09420 [Gaiellales bacterium]|jgi:hypothetical protein|nr:hypothetical protein [Gaiellales bacterium]